jgi:predicted TIM-barrel fold metal-dependent hydrolase
MSDSFKIDAHVHVFTSDMPLIDNPRHAPKYSFTHEQLIATPRPERRRPCGDCGRKPVGRLQRLHPGGAPRPPETAARHRDLPASDGTVRAGSDGPRRFRRGPASVHRPAGAAGHHHIRSLFRRLADLDWHVHPHVDGEDLSKILPTLEASGVKIVVDHLGRPDPKSGINSEGFKALLRSIDKGRTWVKVSGGYRLGPEAKTYARELLRVAGPDRLVWASDCPFVGHEGQFSYQATIDWLVDALPDAAARAKVFGATARDLYFNGG